MVLLGWVKVYQPVPTLGPFEPNIAHRHALHVERTADEALMLSNRVELSSADARVQEMKGGSVGVFELGYPARDRTHIEPNTAFMRIVVPSGRNTLRPFISEHPHE